MMPVWTIGLLVLLIRNAGSQAGYGVQTQVYPVYPDNSLPGNPSERLTNYPSITEVSAMCTQDGITAQFMFNQPFFGMVYSYRYNTVHECVYYNGYDMPMILFSIPNYKCGTRVSKDDNNVVRTIENEIYVQFAKDFQGQEDRRYLFICETGRSGFTTPWPVYTGSQTGFTGFPSFTGFTDRSIRPTQIISVQTAEPTQVIIGGGGVRPNVYMEIQDGLGPNKPPVRRTLQLGDDITLVVSGKTPGSTGGNSQYDMFVHSCLANDGTDQNKVELTDRQGCTVRNQVAGKMQRTKSNGETVYSLPLKAFKFPTSENVYFTCSVDISTSTVPEICPGGASGKRRRSLNDTDQSAMAVSDYIRIAEASLHATAKELREAEQRVFTPETFSVCLAPAGLGCLLTSVLLMAVSLVALTIYLVRISRRLAKLRAKQRGGTSVISPPSLQRLPVAIRKYLPT